MSVWAAPAAPAGAWPDLMLWLLPSCAIQTQSAGT